MPLNNTPNAFHSFGCECSFLVIAGIRYIQENDYPVRGDYDVREGGIDWPRVFAATMSSDSEPQQQQQ